MTHFPKEGSPYLDFAQGKTRGDLSTKSNCLFFSTYQVTKTGWPGRINGGPCSGHFVADEFSHPAANPVGEVPSSYVPRFQLWLPSRASPKAKSTPPEGRGGSAAATCELAKSPPGYWLPWLYPGGGGAPPFFSLFLRLFPAYSHFFGKKFFCPLIFAFFPFRSKFVQNIAGIWFPPLIFLLFSKFEKIWT